MYFNKILMSGNVYGFGTGADYFFGKELNELELDEIALLAGMPQSPNNYNPFKFPDRAAKTSRSCFRFNGTTRKNYEGGSR